MDDDDDFERPEGRIARGERWTVVRSHSRLVSAAPHYPARCVAPAAPPLSKTTRAVEWQAKLSESRVEGRYDDLVKFLVRAVMGIV